MPTIHLYITDDLRDFAIAQAELGGHPSLDEYLAGLLREERRRQAKRGLDAQLLAALEGGPAAPLTRDDWDALEARVRERQQARADQP